MREALVRAAKAQPGVVGDLILASAKRIKAKQTGGWSVDRAQKRGGRRG